MLIGCDYKVVGDMSQCDYTDISYMQPIFVDIFCMLQTLNMHLDLHHIDCNTNKYVALIAHKAFST